MSGSRTQARQPAKGRANGSLTRSAFTLIELLVVIAIIALLAAILFPVFGRARENARKTSCANNLKQIGIGFLSYAQDYDEMFPFAWGGNAAGTYPGSYRWMDGTFPYVKSEQLYTCPSSSSTARFYTYRNPATTLGVTNTNMGTYGANVAYWGGTDGASYPMTKNQADIARPSTTLLAADVQPTTSSSFEIAWQATANNPTVNISLNPPQLTPCNGNPAARHMDRLNILYCDGHVKTLTLEDLTVKSNGSPTNANVYKIFSIQADPD